MIQSKLPPAHSHLTRSDDTQQTKHQKVEENFPRIINIYST